MRAKNDKIWELKSDQNVSSENCFVKLKAA